jgi:hypothetical protein
LGDNEDMKRINEIISKLASQEPIIELEDKPLLGPIKIKETEKKEGDKNQVTMSYQMGEISIDSDEYTEKMQTEEKPSKNGYEEDKEIDPLQLDTAMDSKITPIKQSASVSETSCKLSRSKGDLEIPLLGADKNINDESYLRENKEDHTIKSLTKQKSNLRHVICRSRHRILYY